MSKKWAEANGDKVTASKRKYYEGNTEKVKTASKKWKSDNPDKVRESRHERRKYLSSYTDCAKLNEWFPECQAHHIDPDTIMHIPAQMHNAVYHNNRTGHGMATINRMAFEWLNGVQSGSPQTTLEAFG